MKGLVCVSLLVVSSTLLWAQPSAGFGAVSGVVTQVGGDSMPDARVVLSNTTLGTEVTMVTTDDGVFAATTLIPADGYTLKVTRKDFAGWQSGAFAVSTGKTTTFRIPLAAVGTSAKGEVAGIVPVDSIKTGTWEIVAAPQVQLLPTPIRRLDPLFPLTPAVTSSEVDPGLMVTRSLPFSNVLLLDGLDNTNAYFIQQTGLARAFSQDAVQDFQVMSSNFMAEYGRAMGGMVNVATQSGTISYHGSAYEYFRSRGLEARDAYAAGYDTRQLQHQAGAEIGGPIYGDRLFFFANFEALYRNSDGLNRITNPLIANPAGTAVLPSNCTATVAQCAAATRFLQSQMNVLEPLDEHAATGLAKIDYRRSTRNTFSVEGNAMQWHAPVLAQTQSVAPNGGLIGEPNLTEENRFLNVSWTGTVSPVTVNNLRIGGFQDRFSELATPAQLATGHMGITIAGTTVGGDPLTSGVLPDERRFQLVDNYHRTYGTHLFEVGLDFSTTREVINSLANAYGTYNYPSLTAFAQDFGGGSASNKNYTTYTQTLGNPLRSFHLKEYNFYAQDTWKATRRLTVAYGLRYERPFLPTPAVVNPSFFQTASLTPPWLNLAPRFSMAYLLDKNTVFRASYGWNYAPYPGQLIDMLILGNGLYQPSISINPNQTGAPVFPATIPSIAKIPAGTEQVMFANTKFDNPYTRDITVAIERHVTSDSNLTVGYIRTRGYKLWTSSDTNLAGTTVNETYTIENSAGQATGTYTTPFYTAKNSANFAQVYQVNNGGSFWYDALTAQYQVRVSHGLQLWASYTWSHAIDDLGLNSGLGFTLNSSSTIDPNADRGRSALDQRQRVALHWTWEPVVSGGTAAMRHVANGWALSGLAVLASGQPVTPVVIVQGQQFSAVTMAYTSSLNGTGGWNRVPFDTVNGMNTGSQYTVDARLARTFSFTERIKATLGFEAYNLLNRQYATSINTIAFYSIGPLAPGLINGPRFGTIKPVPLFGTGVASQGFPDGTTARRCQVVLRISF